MCELGNVSVRLLDETRGSRVGSIAGADKVDEAFAVVLMVAMRELCIPQDTMNVLGHSVGGAGARIEIM